MGVEVANPTHVPVMRARIVEILAPALTHPGAVYVDGTSYILDEPEAALSPQRQLSFLQIIHHLESPGHAQFLIATHSPIILAYPGAVLFSLDGDTIREIAYRETDHYIVTRDFLNAPERYFRHLFNVSGNETEDD